MWVAVFAHLASDADPEYAMIDSTIVRAHQHSAGAKGGDREQEAIGRSKGGLTIHATTDALGNPFHLTPGQAPDLVGPCCRAWTRCSPTKPMMPRSG